jgi:hypothetical protein
MSAIKSGQGLIYMKVGIHAKESLEDIIARKTKEIEEAGFAFWGYGGSTCHPQTMVQPFAKSYERAGGKIYLYMEEINSSHFAEPVRADEFSIDGITWQKIPAAVRVLGSRYALALKSLQREEFDLSLSNTRVAIGRSMGAVGSNYVRGRVDKACLEIVEPSISEESGTVHIGLVAELTDPYAVYVRNRLA